MNDQDIRAKILLDLYTRTRDGEEVLSNPGDYASLLGIDEKFANFNMAYLVERNLAKGEILQTVGSTKKDALIWAITSFGIEAVEGKAGQDLAINYNIIHIHGSVTNSQMQPAKKLPKPSLSR